MSTGKGEGGGVMILSSCRTREHWTTGTYSPSPSLRCTLTVPVGDVKFKVSLRPIPPNKCQWVFGPVPTEVGLTHLMYNKVTVSGQCLQDDPPVSYYKFRQSSYALSLSTGPETPVSTHPNGLIPSYTYPMTLPLIFVIGYFFGLFYYSYNYCRM